MKINAINNFSTTKLNFKQSAVPYPEYRNAYYNDKNNYDSFISKIHQFFSPKVTDETKVIKSKIDNIYSEQSKPQSPKKSLLSVLV